MTTTFLFFFDDVAVASLSVLFNAEVTELIESVDADFVVLAEVQPMEMLSEWTASGGSFPNTYWAQFPSQIATDVVAGGLYRRLDEVRQDGIKLAQRSSSAQVDVNLGSYYLDPNGILFVSTTTGAHPDTFALIGAWFTLFFATSSVRFADYPLYSPMLTGTFPTLTNEMPDLMAGSIVTDSGSLEILNTDGIFDKMVRLYVWRNKTVTFKLGGKTLPYTSFETFDTLQINDASVDDEILTLQLESGGSVLNKSLPLRTWGDGTFTGGRTPTDEAPGISAMSQPIVLGSIQYCPCVFAGTIGGLEQWLAYDFNSGPYGTCQITKVYVFNRNFRDGLTLDAIDWAATGPQIEIFNPTYTHEEWDIIATLVNLGTGPTPKFGTMAKAILELCGESSDNINAAAFAAADVAVPQILSRHMGEPKSGADWMSELEQTVNGQVYKDSDGRWTCRQLTVDIPDEYVTLHDYDFVTWKPSERLSASLNEFRVRYAHIPYFDDWVEAVASSDRIRYGNETSDSHRIDSWLLSSVDASEHADHQLFFRGVPPMVVETEQRSLWLMKSRAGDLVSVVRGRGPIARTGSLDGQIMRIVKIEKSLGPMPTVKAWLEDLGGQTDRVGRCLDADVDLDWANATPEQRAVYGFCSDESGYLGTLFAEPPGQEGGRYMKVAY